MNTHTNEYVQSQALKILHDLKASGCIDLSAFEDISTNVFDIIYSRFINILIFYLTSLTSREDEFNNIEVFVKKQPGGNEFINEMKRIREINQIREEKKKVFMKRIYDIDEWSDKLNEIEAANKETVTKCNEVLQFLNEVISHKRYGRSVAMNAKFNIEEYLTRTE